jgi:Uma2 family endonuclease
MIINETVLDPEKEYEIVDGQPIEKIMGGARHSGVGARLTARLGLHVEAHDLGGVYGPTTTFQIGQNQRLPDAAFVSASRIPADGEPDGIWPIAPDLAVEVISPNDLFEKVLSKVREYFAAGVWQVWLISLEHRAIIIQHSLTNTTVLSEDDELVSDDILPGFRCRVSELFRQPSHTQLSTDS